jgi:hypothetical protein
MRAARTLSARYSHVANNARICARTHPDARDLVEIVRLPAGHAIPQRFPRIPIPQPRSGNAIRAELFAKRVSGLSRGDRR